MTSRSSNPPQVHPPMALLDDLELLRRGVLTRDLVDLPASPAEYVDAEGVPLARVAADGTLEWLGERSARPFEAWHRGPDEVGGYGVTLVNAVDQLACLDSARTLVALARLDGDDADAGLSLARAARSAAEDAGVELVIVPPGDQAPCWTQKKDAIAAAYARGGPVDDRTTATPETSTGGPGLVVFFTGLSGSGKSTIARDVRNAMLERSDRAVSLLDGDVVRRHLSAGLGFSAQDRDTNIRRIGWVAAEIARHGGVAICSPIAPFEQTRQAVREMTEARGGRFVLVHVATPLAECERRDRKGLYAKARRGEIADFTGISSPYEEPTAPDLRVDTTGRSVPEVTAEVLRLLVADSR